MSACGNLDFIEVVWVESRKTGRLRMNVWNRTWNKHLTIPEIGRDGNFQNKCDINDLISYFVFLLFKSFGPKLAQPNLI